MDKKNLFKLYRFILKRLTEEERILIESINKKLLNAHSGELKIDLNAKITKLIAIICPTGDDLRTVRTSNQK